MKLVTTFISLALTLTLGASLATTGDAGSPAAPGFNPDSTWVEADIGSAKKTGTTKKKKDIGAVVFYQWRDASNKRILLRMGTYDYKGNGFGWVKIVAKHHILSPLSVKFVTRAPGGGLRDGNEYIDHAYANRKECVRGSCYYTDSVKVRAVVSFSTPKVHWGVKLDGGAIGVKTTYCLNANKAWACPPWVDLAIGAKNASGGKSTQGSTEWSYSPMRIQGADNDRAK